MSFERCRYFPLLLSLGSLAPSVNAHTLTESQRLTSPTPSAHGAFGSVALSGDLLAIGSREGDWNTDGTVHVFRQGANNSWAPSARISGLPYNDPAAFGSAIATDGASIIIGAPQTEGPGSSPGAGEAYLFQQDNQGAWQRLHQLRGDFSIQGAYNYFGGSVDISEGRMIIGAPGEPTQPRLAFGFGAAYIFESDDNWQTLSQTRLLPAAMSDYHDFGASVAVDGDLAVVGAPGGGYESARAYIYQRTAPGVWLQTAQLIGSGQPHSRFGTSVAISDGVVVIGDPDETTIDFYAGAAYVFEQGALGNWEQRQKLTPSDAAFFQKFGAAVEIDGPQIVIGAPEANGNADSSGAAYLFQQGFDGLWRQQARLVSAFSSGGSDFGSSLAIEGNTIAVGAPSEYTGLPVWAGAAFVFNVPEPTTPLSTTLVLTILFWRPYRKHLFPSRTQPLSFPLP